MSPSTIHHAPSISIAAWNVNSVKSRLTHLLNWLRDAKPDIVLLQELKCTEDSFPFMEIEELGYNCAVFGEKTYNGVAILSKFALEDIRKGLDGEDEDLHARYIEAVASLPDRAIRVASVYVPNGQEVGSDKFAYKLRFLERLRAHAANLLKYEEFLVIGGDYNVAPLPQDVFDPVKLDGTVCYHPEERARFRKIMNLGYYDAFRLIHPNAVETFSFWDYRANSFAANHGYRIDHLLLSPQAADRLQECRIASELRALEKASDHAPVVGNFNLSS